MESSSRSASTIAAAVLAVGTLGFSAPGWAQRSISDLEAPADKTDSASTSVSHADKTDSATANASREVRLLTRREGRELVDLALTQTAIPDEKPDCSHLVHQIFDAAGFEYPYATSYQLYAGVPQFQRVQSAQPGDLIVWQGHVGVVVDPAEHSFYSSVGSGLETEQYDNDYWRQRGNPRFYRYLVAASSDAALRKPATRVASESNAEPLAASRVAAKAATGELRGTAIHDGMDETAAIFLVPADIPVPASHPRPAAADVSEAISELTNQSGNILRGNDPATLSSPVIIFDQLQVEKVEFHHDKSWANVRIDYRVELNQGQVHSQHRTEKRRWELQHREDGWVVVNPTDRVYIPADTAAQIISERLYRLTKKSADNRSQQASLARLLDAVFN